MTSSQRTFTLKWIAIFAVVLMLVTFDDFVASHAGWLRWIAFAGVVLLATGERRSRSQMETEGRGRIAVVVASAPWLKAWFGICAASAIALAIYVTRNSVDLVQVVGFRFLVIALVVLMGPLVWILEKERYLELGR